jgi:hypothetical protein
MGDLEVVSSARVVSMRDVEMSECFLAADELFEVPQRELVDGPFEKWKLGTPNLGYTRLSL